MKIIIKSLLLSLLIIYNIKAQQDNFSQKIEDIKSSLETKNYDNALIKIDELRKAVLERKNLLEIEQKTNNINSSEFERLLKTKKSPQILRIGKSQVKVHYGENLIYVLQDTTKPGWPDYGEPYLEREILAYEFKGRRPINGNLIKVGNETKMIKIKSNNPEIISTEDYGWLIIKSTGDVIITVYVDNYFIDIPFCVIQIPLKKDMKEEEVVKVLGIPDKRYEKYLDWNTSKTIDGIHYYVDDVYGETVKHWMYKKYPKVVFRFGVMGLEDIVTPGWDGLHIIIYELENKG